MAILAKTVSDRSKGGKMAKPLCKLGRQLDYNGFGTWGNLAGNLSWKPHLYRPPSSSNNNNTISPIATGVAVRAFLFTPKN